MQISDLQNKLVAVLGYGQEGKAVTKYLIANGIKPVLFDGRLWQETDEADKQFVRKNNLNTIFGPDCLKELAGFDVIFRSPGFPRLSRELTNAEQKGAQITSQTKWFFEHCPATIVGVTGTKGKGTAATLIYKIVKEDKASKKDRKSKIFLTGNIGEIQPLDFLENLAADDIVVYELSSFQLQDLQQSPHVGVVLMVTQEHLDHHQNAEEYRAAKAAVVKFQKQYDYAIINADYDASREIGMQSAGKKMYFSREDETTSCYVKDGALVLDLNNHREKICDTAEIKLRGRHNWENAAAAALTCTAALGCSVHSVAKILRAFSGLPHRLEYAGKINGAEFFNDSFSTTPETAIAAIESFTQPKILILGGSFKNSDFSGLAAKIAADKSVKFVVLIGDEGPRIKQALDASGAGDVPVSFSLNTMPEIVAEAAKAAEPGDVVLLSPACASFGLFKNYKDRGEQFMKAVASLLNTKAY